MTITEQAATGTLTSGLAVEVVDALYPQWAVNGHNIPRAFATVADRHTDPVVRHEAAECPLIPAVTATLEAEFWGRVKVERSAQRA